MYIFQSDFWKTSQYNANSRSQEFYFYKYVISRKSYKKDKQNPHNRLVCAGKETKINKGGVGGHFD